MSSIYILTSNRSCTLIMASVCQTETNMGTYTSNYNLFLPSVGEQGWGELINGNFTTIDSTMKSLSNNIGTLETEANAIEERVAKLETGEFENITVDNITVNGILTEISPTITTINVNPSATTMENAFMSPTCILPYQYHIVYTGSIKAGSTGSSSGIVIFGNIDGTISTQNIPGRTTLTITIPTNTAFAYVSVYGGIYYVPIFS